MRASFQLLGTFGFGAAAAVAAAFLMLGSPVRGAVAPEAAGSATEAVVRSDLDQLGLDPAQRERVGEIRERERRRLEQLERALAETEQELRRAELAEPFDAQRVNALIARRAELGAYLRGTESRVVAEVARLLTETQRARLLSLRDAAAAPPRAPAA